MVEVRAVLCMGTDNYEGKISVRMSLDRRRGSQIFSDTEVDLHTKIRTRGAGKATCFLQIVRKSVKKSIVREPIRHFFCLDLFSFATEVSDLDTPECLDRVQAIKCPAYPSNPSLKVSDLSECCRRLENENVANPLALALPLDFFEARFSRKFDRQNGRKRP